MAVIECPHCGAPVSVESKPEVRAGFADSGDRGRDWVIYESGTMVHRCADTAA
jgi:hypothetical protein